MRYKVFSIRDRATAVYGQPFYSATVGAAVRMFSDEINRKDENSNLYKHPEDFDLYMFGTFDDNTGEFECGPPAQVGVGKDLKV
ncbi:MAG: nonstructural protein [Microviridae sp.]|nr:MAG: nonstructural protein [Microviridae sp.]